MVKLLQAKTIIEISDGDDGLVPIFPAGTTQGVDGRGPYKLENVDAVIAASKRGPVDLVIDRDHQTDYLPPGTPIKAAGWIKELVNKGGAIFARVEWTPAASQELKDKEFRYISPTFRFDKATGLVKRIDRATLTNSPNFNMKAVASARDDYQNPDLEEETETMSLNKILLACASALAIAETSTEEQVLDAVKALASENAELKKTHVATAKALGLKEDDKAETIIATASTIKATADAKGESDPSKTVSLEMYQDTASQLKTLQDSVEEERATACVDEAVKAGKVAPAQRDWAMGYAKKDLSAFKKYVETAPVIATASSKLTDKTITGKEELSEDDKAMCKTLGVSEEDFKKNRNQ